jgi:hypothetical protein
MCIKLLVRNTIHKYKRNRGAAIEVHAYLTYQR